MPLFSRYLVKHYLNVLILCVVSFIAILLVSRLEEIAEFASLGAPFSYLARFTLYHIPYILRADTLLNRSFLPSSSLALF